VPPIVGNKGNEWKELEIDLSPWVGQVIGLRFRGKTSCGQEGDFAIDDLSLTDITPIDQWQSSTTNQLLLYPNPTSGEVTVLLKNAKETIYHLKITDLYGRNIVTQQLNTQGEDLREKVNLTDLPAGIYVVQLVGNTEAHQAKLTVR